MDPGFNQSKLCEVGPEVHQRDEREFYLLNGLHITRNMTKELLKYTLYKFSAKSRVQCLLKGIGHFIERKDDYDKFKFEKQKRKSQFGLKPVLS